MQGISAAGPAGRRPGHCHVVPRRECGGRGHDPV